MPWRAINPRVNLGHIPAALAQIEAIVCMPFDMFGSLCVVDEVGRDSVTLRVRHIGGAKMQATLAACLQRQLELALPGRYEVTLKTPGGPAACLVVRACALVHKVAA